MTKSKTPLWLCAAACIALLAYALYLQHVQGLSPCPLCVIQRYAFLMVAVGCVVGAASKRGSAQAKLGVAYSVLAALAGAGTAVHHLWVRAHPLSSCGIDPLETALNKIWPAQWLPQLFYADGLCSADHAPIFGLNIPQWSLLWFVVLAVVLTVALFRQPTLKA